MITGVTELQAGSSVGFCVFNVWMINRTTTNRSSKVYVLCSLLVLQILGERVVGLITRLITNTQQLDNDLLMRSLVQYSTRGIDSGSGVKES